MLCILLLRNDTCPLRSLDHAVCKNYFIGPIEVTLEKKDFPQLIYRSFTRCFRYHDAQSFPPS